MLSRSLVALRQLGAAGGVQAGARAMSTQASSLTYAKRGTPMSLTVEAAPLAAPSAAQVQVKFLAASVSYADFYPISTSHEVKTDLPVKDLKVRFAKAQSIGPMDPIAGPLGKAPKTPAVGGLEGVAVVEAVGSSVQGLSVGDWVLPSAGVGTWRTHAVVEQKDVVKVRNDIPVEYAACLSISPAAALRLLEDFETLKAGDVIMHNCANGLVGQALIQIAAARGIKVISVMRPKVSLDDISDHLKILGSFAVVPEPMLRSHYMQEVFADLPPVKIAFDGVGGSSGSLLARAMPKGGRIVSFGAASGQPMVLPAEKGYKIEGFYLSKWLEKNGTAARQKMIDTLADHVADGKLKMLLERSQFTKHRVSLNKAFEGMRDRRLVMTF